MTSRAANIIVPCPRCGAKANKSCWEGGRAIKTLHAERIALADSRVNERQLGVDKVRARARYGVEKTQVRKLRGLKGQQTTRSE